MTSGRRVLAAVVLAAAASAARATEPPPTETFDSAVARFGLVPGMPTCASAAPVRGDPRWGASVVLLRLEAGCRVPWHWHTPTEDLVVASGAGVLEMRDGPAVAVRRGAHASLPSGHVHRMRCTRRCTMFSIADGAFDIHYVDASGAEIPMDQAIAAEIPPGRRRR